MINNNHSQLISSKAFRTCTPCCPFDMKNLPHPQIDFSSMDDFNVKSNGIVMNSDLCCLSRLQVDCRIQCPKKKKKKKKSKKNKRYHSMYSSLISAKRSISSSSQTSPNQKRKKFDSTTNINTPLIENDNSSTLTPSSSSLSVSSISTSGSDISEQSYTSNKSERKFKYQNKSTNAQRYHPKHSSQRDINENIQTLQTSIDNLTQLILRQSSQTTLLSNQLVSTSSNSLLNRFRHFLSFFTSLFKSTDKQINHECDQILQYHHLTKQDLLQIYNLFDRNDQIFIKWLRSLMPEYLLPWLLNYVKHFSSMRTDNE